MSSIEERITKQELGSITALSFVPTNMTALYKQSTAATTDILTQKRSELLSNRWDDPSPTDLCPSSFNPDDTILCKLARGEIGPGSTILDDHFAAIGPDMPLLDGSMSLLTVVCVLYNCNSDEYGERRINLFGPTKETTLKLGRDYIAFRDSRLPEIFQGYVEKLYSGVSRLKQLLPEEYHEAYLGTCELMSTVLKAVGDTVSLKELGISAVSFCQTWQKDDNVGKAQFSAMSPLFQTRFYISDASKLPSVSVAQTLAQLELYSKMIDFVTNDMLKRGSEKSFVHVDDLMHRHFIASEAAFYTGITAGSALVGIGPYTQGIVLQVRTTHTANSPLLRGRYKLIGNHPTVSSLITEHMPVESRVMTNMIGKLCSGTSRNFEDVSRAILDTIGMENRELLETHMFSTTQWKVVKIEV